MATGTGNISLPLLDQVRIASPCPARWEDMIGDDRVRHCAQCDLDVQDLSAMTRIEAEGVLAKLAEGRVCARFYRRADGTILTRDCPAGVAAVRARALRAMGRVAALFGLAGTAAVLAAASSREHGMDRVRLRALRPFSIICEWIAPSVAAAPPPMTGKIVYMGDVAWPPPAPTPPNAASSTGNTP